MTKNTTPRVIKSKIQRECDHDWEYLTSSRICTYPECQLEEPMTKAEIDKAIIEANGEE